tara:strand:+ start:1555 stop:2757 length:1203 start_codon:yes stop_codon:yes gene_type:complete
MVSKFYKIIQKHHKLMKTKKDKKFLKIIHLPNNIGGNPAGLSKFLNHNGFKSKFTVISKNKFSYYSPENIIAKENDSLFLIEIKKILALRYIFKNDIIFFNFGTGLFSHFIVRDMKKYKNFREVIQNKIYDYYSYIMSYFEVFLIKLLRKKLLIQYQGDDARQGDYCLKNYKINIATQVSKGYYNLESDQGKRKAIEFYSKFCDKIYALNPDLINVLPIGTNFLPYSHVDLKKWVPHYIKNDQNPIKIGHAPTNREVKGTKFIINAIDKLKREGYEFEFLLIESTSNRKAKEIYKTIDIMIDQLFAGWYGGLALELMSLGKPVVSYIRQEDLLNIPLEMKNEIPIINSNSEQIYKTLKDLINTPKSKLLHKGKLSRKFVEKWHDPNKIAQKIIKDIKEII